jgi:hypothetical protein
LKRFLIRFRDEREGVVSFAKRLADFIDAWMEPLDAPPRSSRAPTSDRGELAGQLLRTLSPQTLRDSGYLKARPAAQTPRPKRAPRRGPQPSPIGDLARPRAEVTPGPVAPAH